MHKNTFLFAAFRKVVAMGLCLALLCTWLPQNSPATLPTVTTPCGTPFESEALATRSLEQDRSPYAPTLTYRLQILSERELRNWLIGITVHTSGAGLEASMRVRAENYIVEFIKSSAEGSILYLHYRLRNAWAIVRSFQEHPNGPSFHDYHNALSLLNTEANRKLISFPPDQREFLDHIWNTYIWKLNTEVAEVTGEEADEISLELRESGDFTLRVLISQWSPAITEWAKGFALHLERKIPEASLTGKQEILFFTRDERPRDPPSGDGGRRKNWRLKRFLPQPLSSLLGFGFAMGIVVAGEFALGWVLTHLPAFSQGHAFISHLHHAASSLMATIPFHPNRPVGVGTRDPLFRKLATLDDAQLTRFFVERAGISSGLAEMIKRSVRVSTSWTEFSADLLKIGIPPKNIGDYVRKIREQTKKLSADPVEPESIPGTQVVKSKWLLGGAESITPPVTGRAAILMGSEELSIGASNIIAEIVGRSIALALPAAADGSTPIIGEPMIWHLAEPALDRDKDGAPERRARPRRRQSRRRTIRASGNANPHPSDSARSDGGTTAENALQVVETTVLLPVDEVQGSPPPTVKLHYIGSFDERTQLRDRPFVDVKTLKPNTVVELRGIGTVVYLGRIALRGNARQIQLLRVKDGVKIEMPLKDFVPFPANRLTSLQEELIRTYLQGSAGAEEPPAVVEATPDPSPEEPPDKSQPPFQNGDVVKLADSRVAVFVGPAGKGTKRSETDFWLTPLSGGHIIRQSALELEDAKRLDPSIFEEVIRRQIRRAQSKALTVIPGEDDSNDDADSDFSAPKAPLPAMTRVELTNLLETELRDALQETRDLVVEVFFEMAEGTSIETFIATFIERVEGTLPRWIPTRLKILLERSA
jgi:hypothetical protein